MTLPMRASGLALAWPARQEILVLVLALAVFTAALAPALVETGTPPGWDPANHLRDSLVIERFLTHPGAVSLPVARAILHGSEDYPLITPTGYYPPLVPAVTALLYRVAGRSYETAMATNLVFLALLCFSIRALGNILAPRPAGLLAALLVLVSPGIRLNAREYMLDLPLAAMVVVAVWALLRTSGFSDRRWSLLFGVLCGAGMLTKWSFFLFLVPPVAWVVGEAWHRRADESGKSGAWSRRVGNLGLALLVALAIAAPYYAPILPVLVRKTWVHAGGAADGFASPFTLASVTYHLEALPRKLLGWPLTLAMTGSILAGVLVRGAARRPVLLLLGWALALYACFTFGVANKQSRYLLPWVPVLLLAAAIGLTDLWRRRGASWSPAPAAGVCALLLLAAAGLRGGWEAAPQGDWKIATLTDVLEKDLAGREAARGVPKVGVVADMQEVNGPTLAYFTARRELPVTVVQLVNRMKAHVGMEVGLDPFGRPDFYQSFAQYDYLVTKTGDNAVPPWEAVVPEMMRYVESRKGELDELASFQVPDGSVVALYARKDR
jgi:hypothetical protein